MDEHDALPPGTRFGELEILRVLGVGGFGIVYLAQDHALERQVALKEYMPGSLAGRGKGQMVSIRSGAHTETYALGLRSFVNEARLLARFNHPSLVKVYRFWEENGTAYMVMPYLQGRTLRDVRRSMTTPPTEAWILSVINPLFDALDLLHREDVYHRDIAPDNILLPPGELPVLLDFGAARRAIGDHTQTFTAILKPSYAPIEQYAEVVQLRQGPWTDLYALGAVVYYLLRGAPPPPATARAVQDEVTLLPPQENPGISAPFLAAIEWALAVRPTDRPQNILALRSVLEGRATVPPRTRSGTTVPDRTVVMPPPAATGFVPALQVGGQVLEPVTIEPTRPMTLPPRTVPSPTQPPVATSPPARTPARPPETTVMPATPTMEVAPPARRPSHLGVWLAAGLGGFVAVAGAAWVMGARSPAVVAAAPALAASGPSVATVAPLTASSPTEIAEAVPAPGSAPAAAPSALATGPTVDASPAPAKLAPAKASPSVPSTAPLAALASPASAATKPRDKPLHASEPASTPVAHHDDARLAERTHHMHPEETAHAGAGIASAAAHVPLAAAPVGAATPREACGSRVFLALLVCMEEQCERPRFKSHPQCDKVREIIERRHRGDGGG